MEIIIGILSALLIATGVAIRNLLKKNEILEDFIASQSEAIDKCNQRLNQIDDKGWFKADDEIGSIFEGIKDVIDDLNNFVERESISE